MARHAVKALIRRPLLSSVAIVSLALGIGANLAILRFVDAVLFQSVPGVREPAQLAILRGGRGVGYPWYREFAKRNDVFVSTAARWVLRLNLTAGNRTDYVLTEIVSGTYFDTLGVRVEAGRLLTEADDGAVGASPVCVLSHALWQQRFGGDPSIVGRSIKLNTHDFQIVGVTEPSFDGSELHTRYDVQVPMSMIEVLGGNPRDSWGWSGIQVLGRLKAGVSLQEAVPRVNTVGRQIDRDNGRFRATTAAYTLEDGRQGLGGVRRQLGDPVTIAMLLSGLVLVLACLNLANLLLARALERDQEIAVRRALGATRGRLIVELLTESVILSAVAGMLALGVAAVLDRLLAAMLFGAVSRVRVEASVSPLLGLAAIALPLATACAIGILPAAIATRPRAFGPRNARVETAAAWPARLMISAQMVICVVLVFGAFLLARSLQHLRHVDLGITPEHVVVATMDPGRSGYAKPRAVEFYDEVLRRAALAPGVQSVALAHVTAVSGGMFAGWIRVPGSGADPDRFNNNFNVVTPEYFRTVGLPIVAGRGFTDRDDSAAAGVVVVNQRFADYYWKGESPIRRRMTVLGKDVEIVGVVRTAKYRAVREPPQIIIYIPFAQRPLTEMTLHARTGEDPGTTAAALAGTVRAIDHEVPVYDVATLEEYVDRDLSNERALDLLSTLLAGLALIVSAAGLYGLVAGSVTRRTREIGIRMAIGAQRSAVLRLLAGETITLVAVGVVAGVPLALAAAKQFETMLYGIHSWDTATLAGAASTLGAIAAAAILVPAARATRVDPAVALRVD